MFAPYGYDALAGYLPPRGSPGARDAAPDWLAQLCGEDSRDIAGLPIDLVQQAIEPTEAQRAALDELANASAAAAKNSAIDFNRWTHRCPPIRRVDGSKSATP